MSETGGFGFGGPTRPPPGRKQATVSRRLGFGFATSWKLTYAIDAVRGKRASALPPGDVLDQPRETTPSSGGASATARCWAATAEGGSAPPSSVYVRGRRPAGSRTARW